MHKYNIIIATLKLQNSTSEIWWKLKCPKSQLASIANFVATHILMRKLHFVFNEIVKLINTV